MVLLNYVRSFRLRFFYVMQNADDHIRVARYWGEKLTLRYLFYILRYVSLNESLSSERMNHSRMIGVI